MKLFPATCSRGLAALESLGTSGHRSRGQGQDGGEAPRPRRALAKPSMEPRAEAKSVVEIRSEKHESRLPRERRACALQPCSRQERRRAHRSQTARRSPARADLCRGSRRRRLAQRRASRTADKIPRPAADAKSRSAEILHAEKGSYCSQSGRGVDLQGRARAGGWRPSIRSRRFMRYSGR
jgi:hypothetical protein